MLRGFTDSTGVEWRVWEVFPNDVGNAPSSESFTRTTLKDTAYAEGWLCFESTDQKRRLAPIPVGWQYKDLPVLEQFLSKATPVSARRGTSVTGATPQSA
jgi:hypothetical protein